MAFPYLRAMLSSTQNPRYKNLLKLIQKSRERRKSDSFVVEGAKEVLMAIDGGYELIELYACKGLWPEQHRDRLDELLAPVIEMDPWLYEKAAFRGTTEGCLGVFRSKPRELSSLENGKESVLYLVAEGIEKPGNIGALLRTADAAGVDGVILLDSNIELFSPNAIRSSVGTIFHVPVVEAGLEEGMSWLKERGVAIYAAALSDASVNYTSIDYSGASAIMVGTESTGLSTVALERADKQVIIPMHGTNDSLNVSVSAAVIVFEAVRQRGA